MQDEERRMVYENVEYIEVPRLPQFRHPHDCTNCEPIGQIIEETMWTPREDGELQTEKTRWDCYVCVHPSWENRGTQVVARFGEYGDYHSTTIDSRQEPLRADPYLQWCIHLLALRQVKHLQDKQRQEHIASIRG
jgi:hypothetical protein